MPVELNQKKKEKRELDLIKRFAKLACNIDVKMSVLLDLPFDAANDNGGTHRV